MRKKTRETLTLSIKAIKESRWQCFGGTWNEPLVQQREYGENEVKEMRAVGSHQTMTSTFCYGKGCVNNI